MIIIKYLEEEKKVKVTDIEKSKSTYISLFKFQTHKWGFVGTHLLKEELGLNLFKKDCFTLIKTEFESEKEALNTLNTILNKY